MASAFMRAADARFPEILAHINCPAPIIVFSVMQIHGLLLKNPDFIFTTTLVHVKYNYGWGVRFFPV